jgi:hypothetical protein
MSDQPHQDALHCLNAHIHILDDRSIKYPCGNMSPPAFLLQVIQTFQDDTFRVGKTVSDVWEIGTRVMDIHVKFSGDEGNES